MSLIPSLVMLPLNSSLPQLLSLNLSSNKLYRLDDMSSIVQKAPNLKILNLSGNEVRMETCMRCVWGRQRVKRTCLVAARGRRRNLRDEDGGCGVGTSWLSY